MMIDLDDLNTLKKLDSQDMLGCIAGMPRQCREAWVAAETFRVPGDYAQVHSVVVLGMGGSAIGGDLVRTVAQGECPVPILVHRDYDVPALVGPDTLVLASSYSGNTEETLSAFDQAQQRGAKLMAMTTGGALAKRAKELDIPLFQFSFRAQPRGALGYSFVPLLSIFHRLGFIADPCGRVEEAVQVMEAMQTEIGADVPAARNPAKQLAQRLFGRLPVVYGSGILSEVARRFKGQLNENAKNWGFFEVMPELNHNAVSGYECPPELNDNIVVVMLRSAFDHPRNQVRFRVTQEILRRRGVSTKVVSARGQSAIAQMLSVVHFGDFVSFYLSVLNQVDPSPVDAVTFLKGELAKA
jgi:glucose/mannose-6-phosphate isomerase